MTLIKNIILILLFFISTKTFGQTDFKFQKLYFYVSPNCHGICEEYHLLVDSNGIVKLHAVKVIKKNTEFESNPKKEGYFTGQLTTKQFDTLVSIIKRCDMEHITDFGVNCCDGQWKKIKVNYNNKVKTIETLYPKDNLKLLVEYIYYIIKKQKLKRTNETW
jgi:hypothetical protein